MARKKFTDEEMKLLRTSPYVLRVSPDIVHFSVEFKEKMWTALMEGQEAREIVENLGIDPNILGIHRINGLKATVTREATDGKGFRDVQTANIHMSGFMSDDVKIRYLEQQLAYKEQEVEFLKKIVSLGKGGAIT